MSFCKVCTKEHSRFVMNNKPVCLQCDELLFDVEIESEEFDTLEPKSPSKEKAPSAPSLRRANPKTK